MRKILLYGTFLVMSFTNAQNLITEGFEDVPTLISTGGWSSINCATAIGSAPN